MNLTNLIPRTQKSTDIQGPESHPLAAMRREMDRLFDEFSQRWDLFGTESDHLWMPKADLRENDDAIELALELPGIDESNVDVSLEGDTLIVSGEKRDERQGEDKEKGTLLRERTWGKFRRAMTVPSSVDRDKIDARFDRGVLTITMPKTEDARRETRRIEIKGKAKDTA